MRNHLTRIISLSSLAVVFVLINVAMLLQGGIIQAIIPAVVPTANRTGTGSRFATSTAAGGSGNCGVWTAAGDVGDGGSVCGSPTIIWGTFGGMTFAAAHNYTDLTGTGSSTTLDDPLFRTPIARAGTFANLFINTNATQLLEPCTVTLMVNGTDTSLAVTIAASAPQGIFSDTTHSVAVNQGDHFVFDVNCLGGSSVQQNASMTFK